MTAFHWILLISIIYCLGAFVYWLKKLLKTKTFDYAEPKGKVSDGIVYSFTEAMLPQNKESAYLHLPTYTAGIIFHLGTFASILLILLQLIFPGFLHSIPLTNDPKGNEIITHYFSTWDWEDWIRIIFGICLCVSSCCGLAILVKRFFNKDLKYLSNLDDYVSNIVITHFQIASAAAMLFPYSVHFKAWAFIAGAIVCFYLPVGKLRHVFYFVAARCELGKFFGSRGVWPHKIKSEK